MGLVSVLKASVPQGIAYRQTVVSVTPVLTHVRKAPVPVATATSQRGSHAQLRWVSTCAKVWKSQANAQQAVNARYRARLEAFHVQAAQGSAFSVSFSFAYRLASSDHKATH